MPQGGSGKQGGNLGSSGSGKKKMSSKSRRITGNRKSAQKGVGGEAVAAEGGEELPRAFAALPPPPEKRAALLIAQQRDLEVEEELLMRSAIARSTPVDGTAPGGNVLGSSNGSSNALSGLGPAVGIVDVRAARMQAMERQHQTARRQQQAARAQRDKAIVLTTLGPPPPPSPGLSVVDDDEILQRRAAARAVAALPAIQRMRRKRALKIEGENAARVAPAEATEGSASTAPGAVLNDQDIGDRPRAVAQLLTMLAERLGRGADSVVRAQRCHKLLCTVLTNAINKGAADIKFRRLKASNATLWGGLLQHPEAIAALELAGFELQPNCSSGTISSFSSIRTISSGSSIASNVESSAATSAAAAEAEHAVLQVALQEQLDGGTPPDPAAVQTLVARLEQLGVTAERQAAAGAALETVGPSVDFDSDVEVKHVLLGSDSELVHPGTAAAMGELGLVLQASGS